MPGGRGGSGQPLERSLRRCLLAVRIGAAAGLDERQLSTAYYVALLQYVGCTTECSNQGFKSGKCVKCGTVRQSDIVK